MTKKKSKTAVRVKAEYKPLNPSDSSIGVELEKVVVVSPKRRGRRRRVRTKLERLIAELNR